MTSPVPVAHRGIITLAVMMATVMQVLDTTIVNVALPYIQGSLAVSQDMVVWVLTSYIAAAAVLTPATGFLSGLWGRKRVYLLAVGGFTVASILCGASQSIVEIVLFRVLQGVFGAALVPLSQATMLDIYPPERHGEAMAIWGTGIMVGPIVGPTLGGYLTDLYSWRWVFYVNVPVGILAAALIWIFVPRQGPEQQRSFDSVGFILFCIAIFGLQVMLDRGETKDWLSHPEIKIELGVAIMGFYCYIVHALTTKRQAFIDLRLFRDRNLMLAVVSMFVVGLILYATLALLPPFLHEFMDYPVVTAGLVLAPRGVGTFISMMLVGRLINRTDPRLLVFVGFCLSALSLWWMRWFNLEMGMMNVIQSGLIQGVGLGLLFVPLSTMAFQTLAPELRTDGSSLFTLLRNIGGSFGISVVQSVLTRRTQMHHQVLGEQINPYNPFMHPGLLPPVWNPQVPQGAAALNAELTRQAGMFAYVDTFFLMMCLTIVAGFLAFSFDRPKASAHDASMSVME